VYATLVAVNTLVFRALTHLPQRKAVAESNTKVVRSNAGTEAAIALNCDAVVIASASRTEGRRFDPRRRRL
jgi:hypothetical protein